MALMLRVSFLKAFGGKIVLSEGRGPKPGPIWGEWCCCWPAGTAVKEVRCGRKHCGMFWGMRLGELTLVAGIS
jgi:hypothetical protein